MLLTDNPEASGRLPLAYSSHRMLFGKPFKGSGRVFPRPIRPRANRHGSARPRSIADRLVRALGRVDQPKRNPGRWESPPGKQIDHPGRTVGLDQIWAREEKHPGRLIKDLGN